MSRRRTPADRAQSIALAWLLCVVPPAIAGEPGDSNDCLVCHNNPRFAVLAGDGALRSLHVDPEPFFAGAHGAVGCLGCHTDLDPGPHGALSEQPPEGVWEQLLASRPRTQRVANAACMSCHSAEATQYQGSIHGELVGHGSQEVPLCSSCHGHHYVARASELEAAIATDQVPATCGSCHGDAQLMALYDQTNTVVTTYETSFHGEKHALGEGRVAVCTSCHGVHNIRAIADPLSTVHPSQRAATCGQCHTGADASFAEGFKHRVITKETEPLVYWVSFAYNAIIYVTIGGMVAFILLDLLRRWLDRRRRA